MQHCLVIEHCSFRVGELNRILKDKRNSCSGFTTGSAACAVIISQP